MCSCRQRGRGGGVDLSICKEQNKIQSVEVLQFFFYCVCVCLLSVCISSCKLEWKREGMGFTETSWRNRNTIFILRKITHNSRESVASAWFRVLGTVFPTLFLSTLLQFRGCKLETGCPIPVMDIAERYLHSPTSHSPSHSSGNLLPPS